MHHSAMHLAFSQLELRIAADTAKRSMAAKRRMSGEAESCAPASRSLLSASPAAWLNSYSNPALTKGAAVFIMSADVMVVPAEGAIFIEQTRR